MTVASSRINSLAAFLETPENYLEIGVDKGTTFLDVKVCSKYAVDPKFKFDPESPQFSQDKCSFFEIISDDFFAQNNRSFDIIFLDGLHEYEQTYRDFNNALASLATGGVIIIDDTFPFDVFSSHRSNSKTIDLRRRFGTEKPGWNGDVFKAMLLIAVYNPDINFCSLFGEGVKSQSFLWKKTGNSCCEGRPSPLQYQKFVHNLEAVHYLWLVENIDLLNKVASMSEVIELIKDSRKK